MSLVPDGSAVRYSRGDTLALQSRDTWTCEPTEITRPAFRVASLPPESFRYGELAVWPESRAARFFPDPSGPFSVNPEEEENLSEAIQKLKPGATEPVQLHQVVYLDVDGDGKEERFYSVFVEPSSGDEEDFIFNGMAFSGAFLADGDNPDELRLLMHGNLSRFDLRGAIDLDGNGRQELIIRSFFYEGDGVDLFQLPVRGKPRLLGSFGCGA